MNFTKLPQLTTPVYSMLCIVASLIINGCSNGTSSPNGSECQRFTKGIYKYKGSEDIRIERTATHQVEYNLKGDGGYLYTDKYAITWTSECEYYLTLESTDHPADLEFNQNDTMWCKVTQINPKGYNFIAVKDTITYQGELVLTAI